MLGRVIGQTWKKTMLCRAARRRWQCWTRTEDGRGSCRALPLKPRPLAGGEDRDSPWWDAADVFVEVSRQFLRLEANGSHLRDAVAIVDRQITILDTCITQLSRQCFSKRALELVSREKRERADTLQGAAWLIIGPYWANFDKKFAMSRMVAWLDSSGDDLRTDITPGRAITETDTQLQFRDYLLDGTMPHPAVAARRALEYLDAALPDAQGHLKGLCLSKKARP